MAISNRRDESCDLDRLEEALRSLIAVTDRLRRENAALRKDTESSNRRLRELEGKLLEANQRRQDVGKRIDELIAQIDHLDAHAARSDA